MKRFLFSLLTLLMLTPAVAQEKLRIAVFDPTSSGTAIDDGTKIAIREIISSTIVNTGKYEIVERSLLERVMQEQQFSQSGAVDDTQITEIGKLAGANKVIVSVVTITGGRIMLSIKMIDVKTASVDRQKVRVVTSGELIDIIDPMTLSLVSSEAPSETPTSTPAAQPTQPAAQPTQPARSTSRLGALFGSKQAAQPTQPAQHSTPEQKPTANDTPTASSEDEVVIYMLPGFTSNDVYDNYRVAVYLDDRHIGSGTLSEGFTLKFQEPHRVGKPSGKVHDLRLDVQNPAEPVRKAPSGNAVKMDIDTRYRKHYEFQVHTVIKGKATKYSVMLKNAY